MCLVSTHNAPSTITLPIANLGGGFLPLCMQRCNDLTSEPLELWALPPNTDYYRQEHSPPPAIWVTAIETCTIPLLAGTLTGDI